jgi:hypothetical protein
MYAVVHTFPRMHQGLGVHRPSTTLAVESHIQKGLFTVKKFLQYGGTLIRDMKQELGTQPQSFNSGHQRKPSCFSVAQWHKIFLYSMSTKSQKSFNVYKCTV